MSAARRLARALVEARTQAELRRRMLEGLGELVPAELLTWDRVELASGAVRHEAVPAEAEPPGAFAAVVDDAAGHPLLSAHAGRWREAVRLSEAVEPRRLAHSGCTAICSTDPVSVPDRYRPAPQRTSASGSAPGSQARRADGRQSRRPGPPREHLGPALHPVGAGCPRAGKAGKTRRTNAAGLRVSIMARSSAPQRDRTSVAFEPEAEIPLAGSARNNDLTPLRLGRHRPSESACAFVASHRDGMSPRTRARGLSGVRRPAGAPQ